MLFVFLFVVVIVVVIVVVVDKHIYLYDETAHITFICHYTVAEKKKLTNFIFVNMELLWLYSVFCNS